MSDKPTEIYKYLSSERISVIKSLQIGFSQVSTFNDALEFRPALIGMGSRSEIEEAVRERLRTNHPDVFNLTNSLLPPDKAQKLIDELVSDFADAVGSQANLERSVKEVYKRLDENFGVLSLSEDPSHPLMWGHYADGGRGFLIEFDPGDDWFWGAREPSDSFRQLRAVGYQDRVPRPYINLPDDIALYTKTQDWSYEKEWRIIRNFNDATFNAGKDRVGKDVLLFSIPPTAIKSIVVGYRMNDADIDQVKIAMASNPAFSHVSLKRATLRDDGTIEITAFL